MKRYFLTYGDEKFSASKARISKQAKSLGIFDCVDAFGPDDLTPEVKSSPIMQEKRGAGLWIWKPDIILSTLNRMDEGDMLVYADAGCLLQASTEWEWYERKLKRYDMIVQRIYYRTDRWTRREIFDLFPDNPKGWTYKYQHCATTVVFKKTPFVMQFVEQWRDIMLRHPEAVRDVTPEERPKQLPQFKENRHDQAIFSALVYKYLESGHILAIWDHIRGRDPIRKQAIRAARLRNGEESEPHPISTMHGLRQVLRFSLIKRPLYHLGNIFLHLRSLSHGSQLK